jgi:O-antigen/teichoic acid export membrane protein
LLAGLGSIVLGQQIAELGVTLVATAILALPLLVLTQFQQFALRAKRLVGQADFVGQIIRPCTVIVLVAIASMRAMQLTSANAMMALLSGAGLAAIVGEFWLRRVVSTPADASATATQKKQWGRTALPMLWISGSHFLLHQMDVLMLGSIAGAENVAPYAVASRLADVVAFSLVVASGIVAPLISSLFHSDRLHELREVLKVAARWVSLAACWVALALFLAREPLLGLFGAEYKSAQIVLTVLIVGQLINAFSGPVGFLLSMTGYQRGSAIIHSAGVATNVALNLWLIPIYHELGAALATVITIIFWNVSMTIFAQWQLGLRATPV